MKLKTLIIGGIGFALAIFVYGTAVRTRASKSQGTASSVTDAHKPAPDFELKSLDGRTVKLSDFRGKAVLLNFWATYCTPCRVEMPWLVDLYKQYHEQGLEIVGVSMDDDGEEQRVVDFVREIKINYPIVLGNHTIGDAFGGTQFLPKTFFIDRQGNISSTTTGMKNKSEFETTIKELLTSAN
jgi:cytochrome c biogenesis protein CcmG/thiol:disulfide interchange protein DsbE